MSQGMIIYAALNKVNGKRYVGITVRALRIRLNQHRSGDLPFGRALRKYGKESFEIRTLETVSTHEELCERERFWIKHFNCMTPNGYNLTTGGDGQYKLSVDACRKISASKLGRPRPDLHPEDLSGQRFSRLLAISLYSRNPSKWLCKCDCGQEKVITATILKNGNTRSCGCLRREVMKKAKTTHGYAGTPIYTLWHSVISRCENQNQRMYRHYGGMGISVCSRWHTFTNFLADVGEKPAGSTFQRYDKSKGYTPDNCRWGTPKEQALNRRQRQSKPWKNLAAVSHE